MSADGSDRSGAPGVPAGFLETPAFVLAARELAREASLLALGREIGPYRIAAVIARGGMGVVYRATDTRLDRDVALKMIAPVDGLPDDATVDRFLREARMTAAIDHDNVVKVFDVGVADGQPYMVSELVDGDTVRKRLEQGALPAPEAVRIAADAAKGLAAAHAAGLVHRDLKPENVIVTRSGTAKILDFGIAKLAPEAARQRATTSTLTGLVLGTAGYLAPEQVRGDVVDARADLFALGSMLFEMLTGQRAFACENTVDTLHAILHGAPPDLLTEAAGVSGNLRAIVLRLLAKAPADRFQSAIDLLWAMEQSGQMPAPLARQSTGLLPSRARRPRAWWMVGVAVSAFALVAVASAPVVSRWRTSAQSAPPLTRFTWTLPAGTQMYSPPAVSPDGSRIAWIGAADDGPPRVYVRALSSEDATTIPGTEGARQPFWSSDGKSIGFFARGKLKRVPLEGGPPVDLADAPDAKGGAWSSSGVIIFQPDYRDVPLMRVSERGGPVTPVTALDRGLEDASHRWPSFLPDGVHFVYLNLAVNDARRGVYLASLEDKPSTGNPMLFASDSGAFYVPGIGGSVGALLAVGAGQVEYRSFDIARLVVTGEPKTMRIAAVEATPHQSAALSASAGALAFATTRIPFGYRFANVNRAGTDLQMLQEWELGGFPRLSPDGRKLARSRVDLLRSNPDIWVDDLERGSTLRLTTSADHDVMPAWSPDGRQVAYRSGLLREPTIGIAAADGSGVRQILPCPGTACDPNDWSADGTYLLVTVDGSDLWKVPVDPRMKPEKLLAEKAVERDARISTDGKWMAYVSEESGHPEVSVRSLSGPLARFVVSSGGGDQPVWRHDGRELFMTDGRGRLQSVTVRPDPTRGLVFSAPVSLGVPAFGPRHWGTTYDVSLDGSRVYFPHPVDAQAPREFGVVLGWARLIK